LTDLIFTNEWQVNSSLSKAFEDAHDLSQQLNILPMDQIASNFKIASMNSQLGGEAAVGNTFRTEAKNVVGGNKYIIVLSMAIIMAIAYYHRSVLLKIYNGGIMNYVWSVLYLTSKGEVATVQVPESSVANSLL
jgi:hypothetical protein